MIGSSCFSQNSAFFSGWIFLLFFTGNISAAEEKISVHPINFHMTGLGSEVFYPRVINADFLLALDIAAEETEKILTLWREGGANAIRLKADSLFSPNDPLNQYLEKNGRLKTEFLARLDRTIEAAERQNLFVILVLFNVERLAKNWDNSPYNKTNGGTIQRLADWFNDSSSLSQAIERTTQLVERYKDRPIFCWEIGHGTNVWELNRRPNNALRESVCYWVIRLANHIKKLDDRKHLLALSFVANTYPDSLLGLPQIDLHFLQIQSQNEIQAVKSTNPYIHSIRKYYKKPVFIAETDWIGDSGAREAFQHNLFWVSLASCSGMFLSPPPGEGPPRIADADLHLLKTAQTFLPELNWDGPPREITVPAEIGPDDSYLMVESLVGYDRVFWILRCQPTQSKARIKFNTTEGMYRYQWFDIERMQHLTNKDFPLLRKYVTLESPEFERSILGLFRLIRRAPQKETPPDSSSAVDVR